MFLENMLLFRITCENHKIKHKPPANNTKMALNNSKICQQNESYKLNTKFLW